MYLRIEAGQIRFRLTQEEMASILKHGQLREKMPASWLRPAYFTAKIDEAATALAVSGNAETLTLHLPPALAETVAASKPSKDGMTVAQTDEEGRTFDLVLEIDIRKPR